MLCSISDTPRRSLAHLRTNVDFNYLAHSLRKFQILVPLPNGSSHLHSLKTCQNR